jgi:ornithine cyclodeaminase/alanine dehydrogenase-like protein (mu-crystallin family)
MTLVLNTEEVVRALALEDYIDAMEEAFTEMGKGARSGQRPAPRPRDGNPHRLVSAEGTYLKRTKVILAYLPEDLRGR